MYLPFLFPPPPLSSLNFRLLLRMSDVQPPPLSLLSLSSPISPPMHVYVLSVLSLFYSSPIPLSSYFSSSAWTFRIFMGRNQCKCCDTIPSSTTFPFSLARVFDLTHPLAISSFSPHDPHLHPSFTVDLFRFIIVVHGSEHNQKHLFGAE